VHDRRRPDTLDVDRSVVLTGDTVKATLVADEQVALIAGAMESAAFDAAEPAAPVQPAAP
jgi:hypothetical protein